jgi:hypothetical protein
MGELALDHLRHAPLLQHDENASRHFGYWAAIEINELGRLEAKRAEIDAIFIDRRAVSLHLLDECDQWAAKGDDIGEEAPAEHRRAHLEEIFGRGVDVVDLESVADDEERMRESTEQCLSVDVLRGGIAKNAGPFGQAAQAVYPLEAFVLV